jgi:hypothetical protein
MGEGRIQREPQRGGREGLSTAGIPYAISATLIRVRPPGYFTNIFITTPVASSLKKLLYLELSRSPNGFLKVLLDPGGGFRSGTAVTKPFRK